MLYDWIKALHVIAVIAWMAGHALSAAPLRLSRRRAEPGSDQSETFKVMERRLLKAIMNPAMIVDLDRRALARLAGRLAQSGWLHGEVRCSCSACPACTASVAR